MLVKELMNQLKRFTNILINCGLFKEKNWTGSNFTILVFLQYFIFSLMHQKVWFSQKNSVRILTFQNFQKRKLFICSLSPHPPPQRCHMSVILFTPGHPLIPQDARALDIFQDWWARMTYGAKYGGSFSEMMSPIIQNKTKYPLRFEYVTGREPD